MTEVTWPASVGDVRRRLGRFVDGEGIELGPGHNPYPLPAGARVRYVDRWEPEENRSLFPELGDTGEFPEPDIVANLDADGLDAVADHSVDFVIASHVLEHMANPLRLLDEIHRVLRAGGAALVLLPDRRHTFDRDRPPTPLDHLVDEHERDVREVDDAHVEDFLVGTGVALPDDPATRADVVDVHRRRSVHVHCWSEDEFVPVLVDCVERLGHHWQLLDAVFVADEGELGHEFGYALRRGPEPFDRALAARRLVDAVAASAATSRAVARVVADNDALRHRLGELEDLVDAYRSRRVVRAVDGLSARLRR